VKRGYPWGNDRMDMNGNEWCGYNICILYNIYNYI
jgi:hypothetical protein